MEPNAEFETHPLAAGRKVSGRLPFASIDALRAERENLEEEIRQLRAAVLIYSEIVRRTAERANSTAPCLRSAA